VKLSGCLGGSDGNAHPAPMKSMPYATIRDGQTPKIKVGVISGVTLGRVHRWQCLGGCGACFYVLARLSNFPSTSLAPRGEI
jgi:hypothetical protein